MSAAATPAVDRDLIDRAQRGDRDALERLVQQYDGPVRRMSQAVCIHAGNAEEVHQETLLALVQSLKHFRGDAALSTWLFAVARHACLKCRKRARRGGVTSLDALAAGTLDHVAAPGASPEAELAQAELLGRLHEAIAALAPAQRQVLVLRDVVGVPATEAARVLGLTVPALKSRLHRARAHVRTVMAGSTLSRMG